MTDETPRSTREVLRDHQEKGFAGEVGFGTRPAIVAVDLILGFTQPESPLGADLDSVVEATRHLIEAGRSADVPILYTTTCYQADLRDAGLFPRKVPSLAILQSGSEAVQIDPRLGRSQKETLIEKKYASAFFGTPLASELTAQRIDTLLVCGATTSGCIRATVVDALQHGFRPIVPIECVGDRSIEAHRANLTDIQRKYGDLVSLETAIGYLQGLNEGK